MMISTRGRYALRVMIDLAERGDCSYIPLKDIVKKEEISQKYLESIMTLLSKNGAVEGIHGKGGGYRLNRKPEEIKVGEILRITEGDLVPVACLERDAVPCERAGECRTLPMWQKLSGMINEYLDSVTLADLIEESGNKL
ncbi:MAG: RrF2 family transcriptional regulator [Lachnospiraceae bacterium]